MSLTHDYGQQISSVPVDNFLCLASVPANITVSGSASAVTLSFATVAGYHLSPGKVLASYDVAGAGKVSVTDYAGTTTYFALDLTAAGAAPFDLDRLLLPISTGMKVWLKAVTGSVGTLNVYPNKVKA